jgi:RNA polymerase sigma factor (sigma-70 family)
VIDFSQTRGPADHGRAPLGCPASIAYSDKALFALEAECGAELESYVRATLRGDPDTMKVVERCWTDLTRKWKRQGELREPRALLFQLAHQRSIDRIRQSSKHDDPYTDPDRLAAAADRMMHTAEFESALVARLDVRTALAELPDRQHRAVLLVYGYGLEYADAAAILTCPVHTVDNLLRAAKATLKQSSRLTGYHQVSSPSSPPEVHK